MNRTVRDVGGLILSIILMVSMYGTYKSGSANVGNRAFNTMHNSVSRAFNKLGLKSKDDHLAHMSAKSLLDHQLDNGNYTSIPDSDWEKGVTLKEGSLPGARIRKVGNNYYSMFKGMNQRDPGVNDPTMDDMDLIGSDPSLSGAIKNSVDISDDFPVSPEQQQYGNKMMNENSSYSYNPKTRTLSVD